MASTAGEASPLAPEPPPSKPEENNEYSRSGNGKFRFKSSSSKSRSKRRRDEDEDGDRDKRHRPPHHRRHHHSSKRHKSNHNRSPSPSLFQDHPRFSPDTAFRESLFDALGDDEGASYWESVYGQPIHNYDIPSVPNGPNGELEQMSDEDYAAYVRSRMWERSREGIMAEQERLRAEKAKHKQQQKKQDREGYERMQFERAMEESLRRGRDRRQLKVWKTAWEEYLRSWDKINEEAAAGRNGNGSKHLRNLLFWPVESGKRKDISRDAVEEFLRHAPPPVPDAEDSNKDPSADLLTTLKAERIRWHPDKIQHRYGVLGIDDVVRRSVTEVFQIVDRMWNEMREKQG